MYSEDWGEGDTKNEFALTLSSFCFIIITEFQFESAEEEKSICELGFFSFVFWSRILTFEKSYYLAVIPATSDILKPKV